MYRTEWRFRPNGRNRSRLCNVPVRYIYIHIYVCIEREGGKEGGREGERERERERHPGPNCAATQTGQINCSCSTVKTGADNIYIYACI